MATLLGTTTSTTAVGTTITLAPFAGTAAGDLVVAHRGTDVTGITLNAPSVGSWTLIPGYNAGPHSARGWYTILAGAPEADYTVAEGTNGLDQTFSLTTFQLEAGESWGTVTAIVANDDGSVTSLSTGNFTGVTAGVLSLAWCADDGVIESVAPSGMSAVAHANGGAFEQFTYAQINPGTGTLSKTLTVNAVTQLTVQGIVVAVDSGASAALTGTAASGLTEQRVRTGGYTLIATLTGDTFVASGATFDAQRQAIINGLDSGQAEAAGWDAVVKAGLAVTDVVRTSNTVCTITLPAFSTYQITATETVTWTLPAAALTGGVAIVASPTFTVTRGAMDLVQPVGTTNASGVPSTSSGSLTGDVAQLTRVTCTIDGVTLDTVRVITSR